MPQKTQNYKLDYFKQGSYYSARSDNTRFVTLDYNLESYIGVAGIGIISGWTVEVVSGLTVQILPGQGFINGFFAESPYTVKQRSSMVAGDREIEVLNENDITEEPLTPSQRAQYVAVVQLYDPSFGPVGDIENSYVKTVVPYSINLSNNQDTYIYAQRPTGATPYSLLADYPPPAGYPPNRGDYSTYDAYKVQLDLYNSKLDAIHNYEWYTSSANHFTEVEFTTSTSYINSPSKVLLARVVTRSNAVVKIDVSSVDNLANFESQIRSIATEYLVEHHHGGNKFFDPVKIKLETDIRDTSLFKYNQTSGRIVYNILERDSTGISLGHKHTYTVDSDGNGQTVDLIGSGNSHFHKITEYVLENPEYTIDNVDVHVHSLTPVSSSDLWGDRFNVYVNDSLFGNESTTYIHVDSSAKTITFDRGVNTSNSKYSTSFTVTLINPNNGKTENVEYSYEGRDVGVYSFMLTMIQDFNSRFSSYYDEEIYLDLGSETVTNIGYVQQNLSSNPFLFFVDGEIAGLEDLQSQSSTAQSLLEEEGDKFTFTPNAAKNITITLEEVGYTDTVKLEFLSNTEVTGKLKTENILFLNANKILTGEFVPHVIPFISHTGRMNEELFPLQYSMVSDDGIRYSVVPTITDTSLGHYHKMLVNNNTTGVTTDVLIGNDVTYYQTDSNNSSYFIYHAHGVQEGVVSSESSEGLLNWQNNVSSVAINSSAHIHTVLYPVIGNCKTIYSMKEDIDGNIYVGTSDGFMIIPQDSAYQFVINGVELYFYGSDLWTLLGKAKLQYESETGNPLVVTGAIYGEQIAQASLTNDGDAVLLVGTAYPNRQTDNIMIKKVSSFKMPNFYTEEINFNDTPIWSIELKTIVSVSQNYISSNISTDCIVAGSNVVAKSVGLNKTLYQPWTPIDIPFASNVIRKNIKDSSGNYWACTNNGILVSRHYSAGDIFEFTSLPGGNPNVQDILSGETGSVYSASSSGIFKTTNGGKSWSKLYDVIGGFSQLARDRTLDKSNTVNGHYHEFDVDNEGSGFLGESIGSGITHVHMVNNWSVSQTMGHTHSMVITLYSVDNSKIIWRSVDNGTSWTQYGILPDGECGDIYAAFGCLFVSQQGGLYKSINGSTWTNILSNKIYSYEWSYDMAELLMGSDNIVYGTLDGITFTTVYSFVGKPAVILNENGVQKYFGYAYSNESQSFHFKNLILSTNTLSALVDFDLWYAQGGSWSNTAPYDLYIDFKRVLSTKYNEDKRDLLGFNFEVDPSNGSIDFSAATLLSQNVSIFDSDIEVEDATGFSVGDLAVIMSNTSSEYFTIEAINGNTITVDSPSSKDIIMPSSVKKIPELDGKSFVSANIYDSLLTHIGTMTHDQIEDGLSKYSDGRPYKFNDTYLSNLLQLTQAIRYAYPDINSEFINDIFYDFRYSWSPSDPIYPSIYNYIDVVTSEIYNQKVYDSNFVGKWAKSINKILVGFGAFSGYILVATDIGIFISRVSVSFEANWFYINDLPYSVYDMTIYGDNNKVYVATSNGTYYSSDLRTWTLENAPAIFYPSYSIGLRWYEQPVVSVSSHTADFVPNITTNLGTITATGTIYKDLNINKGIKISGAGTKSGNYIVTEIGDGGSGFGSQIVVAPSFSGPVETKTGVTMVMGSWWGQWDGYVNTSNANITNILLVGGENHISYNDGPNSWREATFPNVSGFIPRQFLSLSNGRILLAATGTNSLVPKNYLLKSDDTSRTWSIFKAFEEVNGTILSSSTSDFNNTVLKVSYLSNSVYANGIFDQQDISIFDDKSNVALSHGKVVWNENGDGENTVVVWGNYLDSLTSGKNYTFTIYPLKVNTMTESYLNTLFFGTDKGMYYDVNTAASNVLPEGTVVNAGINGIVSKIDISGTIVSLGLNKATGNTTLAVTTDAIVRGSEVVGKNLYITDTDPVEKYAIVSNTSCSPGNEFVINIDVTGSLSDAYVGKKIRIAGDNSRVYVNFDLPVIADQFKGGTLHISSDEYDNIGVSYKIDSNTSTYIDLETTLIPSSTLVLRNSDSTASSPRPLQVGQNIRLIDSSNNLTLWVSLDREIKENVLNGLNFTLTGAASLRNRTSAVIYSNLKNSITLYTDDVLNYSKGDTFAIKGTFFEQLGGFSHLKTSEDSGHYHDANTVNAVVSGEILSFSNVNSSYVDINVTNTSNFNTPLVQYSGDLFEDAQIVFTTPESINLRYVSEVVSHTTTSIKVRIKSSSYWDFTAANTLKVSEGWVWEIDGTNYGYTSGITYNDFVTLTGGITQTANRGSNQLSVASTTGMFVNDKVMIQDDTLSYETHTISSIISPTAIQISTVLGRTYFLQNNPQIKVLKDSFANTHIHQIRDNEVQPLFISEYLDNGYPASHSHRVLPLITDVVSTLLNQNNNITAFGSGSIIYKSSDNGQTWSELIDLNNFVEGNDEITGVSTAILSNDKLIVGATNGSLFVQTDSKNGIVSLISPT
jgi:photosystem II stability/assembly factor-like uncharacterized protein